MGDPDRRAGLERMLRDMIGDADGMVSATALQAEVRDAGCSWRRDDAPQESMESRLEARHGSGACLCLRPESAKGEK